MLLNSKKLAFLGLLLAATELLIILSGVFEFNTLFLLGAASFGVGIAIREAGLRIGVGFYIAAFLLGIMLAPNKLYCITFAMMGLYLLLEEFAYDRLAFVKIKIDRKMLFWIFRYIAFNLIYLPVVLFFPKLIYQGELSGWFLLGIILAGQVVLLIYDMAYHYFQQQIWSKVRSKLKL